MKNIESSENQIALIGLIEKAFAHDVPKVLLQISVVENTDGTLGNEINLTPIKEFSQEVAAQQARIDPKSDDGMSVIITREMVETMKDMGSLRRADDYFNKIQNKADGYDL